MFNRKLVRNTVKITTATLLLLLLAEAGVRLVYYIRNSCAEYVLAPYVNRISGPVPPWLDDLRITEPDEALMWKGRRGVRRKYVDVFSPSQTEEEPIALLRRFSPFVPDSLMKNPVWEVTLNSDGFRDEEIPKVKPPSGLRIVCLGDSWTFGANANQQQAYPQLLKALLRKEFPEDHVEVINLGVVGYSSYQGLELLKRSALKLNPDIVIIGFAMNDSVVAGWRDKDTPPQKTFELRRALAENLEAPKLLKYLVDASRFKAVPMSEHLKAMTNPERMISCEGWISAESLDAADYEKFKSKTRVSPDDYESNIREMIALTRSHGAAPIMLYNELRQGTPYQLALEKISREEGVALVDSSTLIAEARRRIETELEEKLNLKPSEALPETGSARETEVVFRVYMGEWAVPKAVYITGPHTPLGDAMPNHVAMYNDGTHGDQRAADRVWSYTASFPPGTKIFYVYTNSGKDGTWENLDVPKVRSYVVPATSMGKVYLPVETFGKIYMQADPTHPDAAGYELIARGLSESLKQNEKFTAYVQR